jgi:hypothetical protein
MSQTELVKQCLRFEIGNPDGRDLAVPDGLTVDDLDDRGGAHNTLVDDRVDVAVFGDNADVAEPRNRTHREDWKALGRGRASLQCACHPREDNWAPSR